MTGVGGTERFACEAPVGAQCTSISGVYANANAHGNVHSNVGSGLTGTADADRLPSHHANTLSPLLQGFAVSTRITPPEPLSDASASQLAIPTANTSTAPSPASLRAPPRVVRLWIAPWEDTDGDLHEASLVHVVIDTGRWLIERVRPAARSRLDVARPPLGHSTTPAPGPEPKSPASIDPTEP